MRSTVCLGCGNPTLNGSRCIDCSRGFRRSARNPMYDTPEWRARRRTDIDTHLAGFGLWCPGWGVPAHRVRKRSDLTDDHVIPGSLEGGTQVLCRACNTRRSHAHSPRRRC
jgi:5-methylcytosine-specific restriction enzyme A